MDSPGLSHVIARFDIDTFLEETFIFLLLFTEHEHAVYEEQSTYCET